MKKEIVIFILILFFLPIVMGLEDGDPIYLQQNREGNLTAGVTAGGLPSSSIGCNITVFNPRNSIIVDYNSMISNFSIQYYQLNSSQTTILGCAEYLTYCSDGINNDSATFIYCVTKNGERPLETSESVLYVILTVSIFIFFALSLYFTWHVPYKNKTDNRGFIIGITKAKYIKMSLVLVTYSLFVWFLNLLIGISENFINLYLLYGLVRVLFTILSNLAIYLFIAIFVWAMFEIVRDANINKLIKKLGKA